MPKRNYSSTAVATTLDSSGLAADVAATTCTVVSSSGFPSVPFTLVLSPDTLNEEIVTVTARSGNILTVSRNQESSGLHAHAGGAVAKHMITGRDLQEAQDHIYTTTGERSTGVHGLNASTDGVVVGSTQTIALTNKEISGALNTFVNNTIAQEKIINLVTDLSNKAPNSSPSLSNPTFTGTVTASGASSASLPTSTSIGSVTSAEIARLAGVTSGIQGQLNAKAVYPDQTGNAGRFLTTNGATTSWAAVSGGSGTVLSITAGTGLTGGTITTSGTIAIDSTVATLTGAQSLTNKKLTFAGGVTDAITANSIQISSEELSRLDGVSSNIQTQIDGLKPLWYRRTSDSTSGSAAQVMFATSPSLDASSWYYFKFFAYCAYTFTSSSPTISLTLECSSAPTSIRANSSAVSAHVSGGATISSTSATGIVSSATANANYIIQVEGFLNTNASTTFTPKISVGGGGVGSISVGTGSHIQMQKLSTSAANINGSWV